MPYNIEPIPPADEINGQTALPVARVKRIIKLDDDVQQCSNSAAFLVAVATEMFIQHLAKQGMKGAQRDRRKNLQYKDLANAVAVHDNLEFLSDIIPRTMPYKKVLASRNAVTDQPGLPTPNESAKKGIKFPVSHKKRDGTTPTQREDVENEMHGNGSRNGMASEDDEDEDAEMS